jgi:hypothetical protein
MSINFYKKPHPMAGLSVSTVNVLLNIGLVTLPDFKFKKDDLVQAVYSGECRRWRRFGPISEKLLRKFLGLKPVKLKRIDRVCPFCRKTYKITERFKK